MCWICYDDDPALGGLVAPCKCSGTVAYVHNDCLVQWLKAKPSSELECSICRAPYTVSKEKMTVADMRKLACTVFTFIVMLVGVGCMAWVKLRRVVWLAGSDPLEGKNPSGVFIAVVFGFFNLRRLCRHVYSALTDFQSGVDAVNKGRLVRVQDHAQRAQGAAQSTQSAPAGQQECSRQKKTS
eukprot:Tamp_03644.p2 GENE.Tamp_03644~~Tamp_03644.p2  ORF type:complete len:183 (+),score=28.92 Tamp_03644:2795-3343(+)